MSSNEDRIRQQIYNKIHSSGAYYCPTDMFYGVETDINEFPYRRYFRGERNSAHPIVWGREPGYQKIVSSPGYVPRPPPFSGLTDLCFQIPCSTILPCNKKNYDSNLDNTNTCVFISP
jgi:hypothetical protein